MKENLVQWTLLQNLDFLSKYLDFQIAIRKGQEINNIFSLDLQLKKNRLNLNFKYLD